MRVLTSEEVRQAERAAASRPGMSKAVLVQRTGSALVQFSLANFKFNSVSVVCGRGQTGGAGLAAVGSFSRIADHVSAIVLANGIEDLEPDTASMCSRLIAEPLWIANEADFETTVVQDAFQADLIIDAIAGADNVPLRDLDRKAVEAINDAFGTVVSADLPSGINADSTTPLRENGQDIVLAHGVVAFVAPKLAHVLGELTSGPIAVSEIGVQPTFITNSTGLQVITGQEVGIAFLQQVNSPQAEDFGHALVIAGSPGKAGIAALAGLATLRSGAGAVTVACPKSIEAIVAGFAPELVTAALPETDDGSISAAAAARVEELLPGKHAVVLGPGLPANQETATLVRRVLACCPAPLVLDSDVLNALEGKHEVLRQDTSSTAFRVITLNLKQAARLLECSIEEMPADVPELARRLARQTGCCVVLKGPRPMVAGVSGETWISMTGDSSLARGACSEVLPGMIGAALARSAPQVAPPQIVANSPLERENTWVQEISGIDPGEIMKRRHDQQVQRNAAQAIAFLQDIKVAAAVYLHGLAGAMARNRLHHNIVVASDLVANLAEAFCECNLQMDQALFYLQK